MKFFDENDMGSGEHLGHGRLLPNRRWPNRLWPKPTLAKVEVSDVWFFFVIVTCFVFFTQARDQTQWGPEGWGPDTWGPEGWGPEGWGTKPSGGPKGGAQNFALFFPLPPPFRSFCVSLGVFSWNFGGV